jgi:hypothetical protein
MALLLVCQIAHVFTFHFHLPTGERTCTIYEPDFGGVGGQFAASDMDFA